jgi:Lon protease-like protein
MSAPLTLHSLPLFPLGTVLFPAGSLPLQVFEVRYLDMIGEFSTPRPGLMVIRCAKSSG